MVATADTMALLFTDFDRTHEAIGKMLGEMARTRALRAISPLTPALQALVNVGRAVFDTPICLVTTLDSSAARCLSASGTTVEDGGGPVDESICQYTLHLDQTLALDTLTEEWSPGAVRLGLKAYLGSPWHFNGQALGTFCALDTKEREWTMRDVACIERFAGEIPSLANDHSGLV